MTRWKEWSRGNASNLVYVLMVSGLVFGGQLLVMLVSHMLLPAAALGLVETVLVVCLLSGLVVGLILPLLLRLKRRAAMPKRPSTAPMTATGSSAPTAGLSMSTRATAAWWATAAMR